MEEAEEALQADITGKKMHGLGTNAKMPILGTVCGDWRSECLI